MFTLSLPLSLSLSLFSLPNIFVTTILLSLLLRIGGKRFHPFLSHTLFSHYLFLLSLSPRDLSFPLSISSFISLSRPKLPMQGEICSSYCLSFLLAHEEEKIFSPSSFSFFSYSLSNFLLNLSSLLRARMRAKGEGVGDSSLL